MAVRFFSSILILVLVLSSMSIVLLLTIARVIVI